MLFIRENARTSFAIVVFVAVWAILFYLAGLL
jgi:hypothetical protein